MLLSTHILQEVEAVADRLVIINEGRIVGDGTLRICNKDRNATSGLVLAVLPTRKKRSRPCVTLPQVTQVRFPRSR